MGRATPKETECCVVTPRAWLHSLDVKNTERRMKKREREEERTGNQRAWCRSHSLSCFPFPLKATYLVQPVEALLALAVANHLVRVQVGQQGRHRRAVVVRLVQGRLITSHHIKPSAAQGCVSSQDDTTRFFRPRLMPRKQRLL